MRLLIFFACALCSQSAWAYIDPGTGALLVQGLLGPVDIQLSQTKVQTRCKKAM